MKRMNRALVLCDAVMAACHRGLALDVPPLETPRMTLAPVFMLDDGPSDADQKPTSPAPGSYGITGPWFGARDHMEQGHVSFGGMVLLDVAKNFRGGLDTESWPVRYLLDLHLVINADAMGLPGGTGYVDFQSHDESENHDVAAGDIQAYDNLEGPRYVAVTQAWYKQAIGDFRLKIGKIDANTDAAAGDAAAHDAFSFMPHGLLFLHSAAAYAPTITPMVTFPYPAPGVQLFYGGEEGPYAGVGAFYANSRQEFLTIAGHPEMVYPTRGGFQFIGETGAWWKLGNRPGHAGVGGWYHSGAFALTDNPREKRYGAGGGYALVDQSLYVEEVEGKPARDLGMFFTAGWSSPATIQIDQSLTLGLSATGFVPGRDADSFGVMTSWAHLPAENGAQQIHAYEWATEIYYNVQILPWAAVRPAFDYIVSPGGVHPDAALGMVRVEIDF